MDKEAFLRFVLSDFRDSEMGRPDLCANVIANSLAELLLLCPLDYYPFGSENSKLKDLIHLRENERIERSQRTISDSRG